MNPAAKAPWFIENHFGEELTLDDIATSGGVSRFHMARVFGIATGHSVMGYVRGRRLTEAARKLAGGAPDILAVALDAGYNSHEAFTRAFRDRFGVTPEALRARGNLDEIKLTEPIKMDETLLSNLEPPRRTWYTIWNKWLPESGYRAAEGPELERYGKEFDPRTGSGGFEIWIPIKKE